MPKEKPIPVPKEMLLKKKPVKAPIRVQIPNFKNGLFQKFTIIQIAYIQGTSYVLLHNAPNV